MGICLTAKKRVNENLDETSTKKNNGTHLCHHIFTRSNGSRRIFHETTNFTHRFEMYSIGSMYDINLPTFG